MRNYPLLNAACRIMAPMGGEARHPRPRRQAQGGGGSPSGLHHTPEAAGG